jgi:hypothetical protein
MHKKRYRSEEIIPNMQALLVTRRMAPRSHWAGNGALSGHNSPTLSGAAH